MKWCFFQPKRESPGVRIIRVVSLTIQFKMPLTFTLLSHFSPFLLIYSHLSLVSPVPTHLHPHFSPLLPTYIPTSPHSSHLHSHFFPPILYLSLVSPVHPTPHLCPTYPTSPHFSPLIPFLSPLLLYWSSFLLFVLMLPTH